jgi:hypothetical protein
MNKEYEELKKKYKQAVKCGYVEGIEWNRSPFSGHQSIKVVLSKGDAIEATGGLARLLLHYIEIM